MARITQFSKVVKLKSVAGPPINIFILMAGRGERFRQQNFSEPKPLILWQNKPLFHWALESVRGLFPISKIHLVICEDDQIEQDVRRALPSDSSLPEIDIIVLKERTSGPAQSAEKALKQSLVTKGPVIFCDCDLICTSKQWENFVAAWPAAVSGTLLWFHADDGAKHSFLKADDNFNVLEVAEKKAISDKAVAGIYAFQSPQVFLEAAESVLASPHRGEIYLSHIYAELIKKNKTIRAFSIDRITLLGTPEDFQLAEPWQKSN